MPWPQPAAMTLPDRESRGSHRPTFPLPGPCRPLPRPPRLSPRLTAVVEMAGRGRVVADVGTDHGLVPLGLLASGAFERAIAIDRRPLPLEVARRNRDKAALDLELRLGDGLAPLAPHEADTLVLAGFGGHTMCSVLDAHPSVTRPQDGSASPKLVLQPLQQVTVVKTYLADRGYTIASERVVTEGRRAYVVLAARFIARPP